MKLKKKNSRLVVNSNFFSNSKIKYNLRTFYKLYCGPAVMHRPPSGKPLFCHILKGLLFTLLALSYQSVNGLFSETFVRLKH
jgi:hypothetical protein